MQFLWTPLPSYPSLQASQFSPSVLNVHAIHFPVGNFRKINYTDAMADACTDKFWTPLPGPIFFLFMQFSWKFGRIIGWRPLQHSGVLRIVTLMYSYFTFIRTSFWFTHFFRGRISVVITFTRYTSKWFFGWRIEAIITGLATWSAKVSVTMTILYPIIIWN